MYKNIFVQVVFAIFFFGINGSWKQVAKNSYNKRDLISCGPGTYYSLADLPAVLSVW